MEPYKFGIGDIVYSHNSDCHLMITGIALTDHPFENLRHSYDLLILESGEHKSYYRVTLDESLSYEKVA